MSVDEDLRSTIVEHLRAVHAVKEGALAMFDPMLRRVAAERDSPHSPDEVVELLGKMHGAFTGHREETATHALELSARIEGLGAGISKGRMGALTAGARAWISIGSLGGTNHGANARNAFVFEHFEIASLRLLAELAKRAEDEPTVELVERCIADDEEMAATINRNWTNVLTLTLAA